MKKFYTALTLFVFFVLLAFGCLSFIDDDIAISTEENRALAQQPEFTIEKLIYEGYTEQYENYYADQFPFRNQLLKINKYMNRFYYFSGSKESNALVVDFSGQAEDGGESITTYEEAGLFDSSNSDKTADMLQKAESENVVKEDDSGERIEENNGKIAVISAEQSDEDLSDETEGEDETHDDEQKAEAQNELEQEEPLQNNSGSTEEKANSSTEMNANNDQEVFSDGSIAIIGNRAMDIPYGLYSVIAEYAEAVNKMSAATPNCRFFSILVPNAAAFYAPDSFAGDSYDQNNMFEFCYNCMQNVYTVDAYSLIQSHQDEDLYFRTDHHWTALGAYYAYQAFCESASFTPLSLSDYETGVYENFVGSLYGYTSAYPQSQVLLDNPDTLTYYINDTIRNSVCTYYYDSSLTNGGTLPVVSTKLAESVSNKYLCFVGGDFPVECIETGTDGPVCILMKDSYGNAFAPFLTAHYSKIYLIDPREFNRGEDYPSLNLAEFAARVDASDIILLNYPFMINNESYVKWLNYLVDTPVWSAEEE